MIISEILQNWYEIHKRELPWRATNDPFKIWLSEIILQQTRVDQGLSYYLKFTERFKTVSDLAEADEEEVLKLWQGLGYYSRARNLHAAAKQVQNDFGGEFPSAYDDILKLKGVGPYTAAAISSFAFQLPYAVVDGNVYRVLSRLFNEDSPINSTHGVKLFQSFANDVLDRTHPDTHNQAIMEFGARLCTPTNPNCDQCPLQDNCQAFISKTQLDLPVKLKKTKVKERHFNYYILLKDGSVALEQRLEKGIWHKMYQPILHESNGCLAEEELLSYGDFLQKTSRVKVLVQTQTHKLSHQHIHSKAVIIEDPKLSDTHEFQFVPLKNLKDYPIPRLVERIFVELELL